MSLRASETTCCRTPPETRSGGVGCQRGRFLVALPTGRMPRTRFNSNDGASGPAHHRTDRQGTSSTTGLDQRVPAWAAEANLGWVRVTRQRPTRLSMARRATPSATPTTPSSSTVVCAGIEYGSVTNWDGIMYFPQPGDQRVEPARSSHTQGEPWGPGSFDPANEQPPVLGSACSTATFATSVTPIRRWSAVEHPRRGSVALGGDGQQYPNHSFYSWGLQVYYTHLDLRHCDFEMLAAEEHCIYTHLPPWRDMEVLMVSAALVSTARWSSRTASSTARAGKFSN